jgi:hypothetical protein
MTGSYATPSALVQGLAPAILAGAGAMGLASLVALVVPRVRPKSATAISAQRRVARPATVRA